MYIVKRIFVFIMILLGGNQAVKAHAIWLESSSQGTKGKAHTVKVFYGEYATGELEDTKSWYSDLKSLTLQLVDPNEKISTLPLVDKGQYLEASFVPDAEGAYQLFTRHAAKDLGGETRYEFIAQAIVQVGKSSKKGALPLGFQLDILPEIFRLKDKVSISLRKDGQPAVHQDILVMSESGWSKTYKTDEQGHASIDALWAGRYVVEFSNMDVQGGDWHGKAYKRNWQGLTISFLVQ